MREILFRGKRADNGEWVEGYLVYSEHRKAYYILTNITSFPVEVIPETIGQYTGLKDKKEKWVFEGYIIKTEKQETFVIGYNEHFGGFVAYESQAKYAWEFVDEIGSFEIIGNIHDNPELLKGGAE